MNRPAPAERAEMVVRIDTDRLDVGKAPWPERRGGFDLDIAWAPATGIRIFPAGRKLTEHMDDVKVEPASLLAMFDDAEMESIRFTAGEIVTPSSGTRAMYPDLDAPVDGADVVPVVTSARSRDRGEHIVANSQRRQEDGPAVSDSVLDGVAKTGSPVRRARFSGRESQPAKESGLETVGRRLHSTTAEDRPQMFLNCSLRTKPEPEPWVNNSSSV